MSERSVEGATPAPSATEPGVVAPALCVEGLTKAFGSTVANRDMSIDLRAGEVHGLLGQNGAGKSTLVGMLTGHLRPDAGRITVGGEPLEPSPAAALQAGIVAVYQNLMLVPSMTGLENVALALGQSASPSLERRLDELAGRFGLPLALGVPVERLDMAARQRIEFVRALCQEPAVLLLDEPTTFLPPTQIDDFLETVRKLADSGVAVMMITHRLEEARRLCDRVTVIRSGEVVTRYERAAFPDNHDLAMAMLGESVTEPAHTNRPGARRVLTVSDLSTSATSTSEVAIEDLSLTMHEGEILGIAGVDGNGQMELLEAIAGLRSANGTVRLEEQDVSRLAYPARFEQGLQLVSGDRMRHGIVPGLSVFDHFDYALANQDRAGVLERLRACDVRPLDLDIPAASLSGGNQQKVMLARALAAGPKVLLLGYPTQGLDVSAAARIHAVLLEQARRGIAVVVVSSDLDEMLGLCDRVAVMFRGRVVGSQHRDEIDRRVLARWFTGVAANEEHELAVG